MTRSPRLIPPFATGLLLTTLMALATAAAPALTTRTGNAVLGQDKADAERCIECHGADGQGGGHSTGSEAKFPKLAGQHADYLSKQLSDFRSGARRHDVMAIMARSVEEADLRDIVAYFASRPRMQGDGSGERSSGRTLYREGDPARGIAACASCHGEAGDGLVAGAIQSPMLAGQEWLYLGRQMLDWRSGWRKNSAGGVMNSALQRLSDAEIKDLASYLSGLRTPMPP